MKGCLCLIRHIAAESILVLLRINSYCPRTWLPRNRFSVTSPSRYAQSSLTETVKVILAVVLGTAKTDIAVGLKKS